MKTKLSLNFLLFSGFLFSSFIGFTFNLNNGFIIQDIWLNGPELFDVAFKSEELALTTQVVGYLFYLVFGITCYRRYQSRPSGLNLFFVLCGFVLISDLTSFILDAVNLFPGFHFRFSFLMFLIGLYIYLQVQKVEKTDESLSS